MFERTGSECVYMYECIESVGRHSSMVQKVSIVVLTEIVCLVGECVQVEEMLLSGHTLNESLELKSNEIIIKEHIGQSTEEREKEREREREISISMHT